MPDMDHLMPSPVSSTTQRLIRARAESIVHDRIRTADPAIFGRKLVSSPSYDIVLADNFLSLLVYPNSTSADVERRKKKFGSVIPMLLEVEKPFISEYQSKSMFLINGDNSSVDGGTFEGNGDAPIFALSPDIHFGLRNVTVSIPSRNIFYSVPLVFTVAFGSRKRITRADEYLDTAATFFLTTWTKIDYSAKTVKAFQ